MVHCRMGLELAQLDRLCQMYIITCFSHLNSLPTGYFVEKFFQEYHQSVNSLNLHPYQGRNCLQSLQAINTSRPQSGPYNISVVGTH